ncbi:hypothetical protein AJ78_00912 [Emergomyces pasteurianus Ep9510]|uniref:Uncharacterized protein n=1 Tax=Emergomyces pasteurianus Ep9510 TaxID=1447872 RepID=A0A1J9PSB2_9EURO|nr:hypothetical protein AJ78_00912 [Emergomyces pasteurianus Ep9510]
MTPFDANTSDEKGKMDLVESTPSSESRSESHIAEASPKINFSLLSCLGVNFSITATPLAIGTYLALSIGTGGPPFFFYEFVFAGIGQIILCLALAELASSFPHALGPAHWVAVLGPKKYARQLGYIMGWLTNACWFFICAASYLFLAQLTMAIVEATIPTYAPKIWHTYLLYIGFALNGLLVNLPGAFKMLSWSLKAAVFFINGSAVFVFASLLARAHPKQSARTVFVDVVNETGWSSNVVVFFLCILPGVAGVGGLDSAPHLTDEVDNPKKQIPQVMIGSALLSFFTGIPSILIYLFCNTNPEGLIAPVGGQPLIQLFLDAYNSRALTILASVCVIITFNIAAWSALTSWSRLYWSFSKDGGLPFSTFTAKLSSFHRFPINALVVNTGLLIAIGAIQIGSTTALNALLGGASLCGKASWFLPIVLLLWRGRDALDKSRWLKLGRCGFVINVLAAIWAVWVSVWISFPLYIPVTAPSMNYAAVVFAGVSFVGTVYYFVRYRGRITA